MALENSNMYMPVAPAYGNSGFGGDWGSWIILFLIFGMFNGGGFGGFGGGYDFPWLLNGQNGINNNTNARFDYLGLSNQITGIGSTLNSMEIANCNRAADAMQTAYNNQIASMNQNFANQQALDARLYAMQSQQADCCCENRLATCQTQNLVQVEAANTRAAASADSQKIMDKLCQLELDGVRSQLEAERRENLTLQNQLNMQAFRADNVAQTAQLIADNAAQTQYVVNRIAPYPIPSYNVPNPYGCNGCNNSYGFAG